MYAATAAGASWSCRVLVTLALGRRTGCLGDRSVHLRSKQQCRTLPNINSLYIYLRDNLPPFKLWCLHQICSASFRRQIVEVNKRHSKKAKYSAGRDCNASSRSCTLGHRVGVGAVMRVNDTKTFDPMNWRDHFRRPRNALLPGLGWGLPPKSPIAGGKVHLCMGMTPLGGGFTLPATPKDCEKWVINQG